MPRLSGGLSVTAEVRPNGRPLHAVTLGCSTSVLSQPTHLLQGRTRPLSISRPAARHGVGLEPRARELDDPRGRPNKDAQWSLSDRRDGARRCALGSRAWLRRVGKGRRSRRGSAATLPGRCSRGGVRVRGASAGCEGGCAASFPRRGVGGAFGWIRCAFLEQDFDAADSFPVCRSRRPSPVARFRLGLWRQLGPRGLRRGVFRRRRFAALRFPGRVALFRCISSRRREAGWRLRAWSPVRRALGRTPRAGSAGAGALPRSGAVSSKGPGPGRGAGGTGRREAEARREMLPKGARRKSLEEEPERAGGGGDATHGRER